MHHQQVLRVNKQAWAASMAALNITALSLFSGFRFDHVASLNWDIILMLTPYGIIRFLFIESDHYLRPYYFQPNLLETSGNTTLLLIVLQIVLSTVALTYLAQAKKL